MVMVTGPRQSGKTTTLRHLFGKTHRYVSLEPPDTRAAAPLATKTLWDRLLRGGYPELVAEPRRDPVRWHASYVQTYLERDVRSLRQVGDLTQFQMFLRALARGAGSY